MTLLMMFRKRLKFLPMVQALIHRTTNMYILRQCAQPCPEYDQNKLAIFMKLFLFILAILIKMAMY